MTPGRFSPRSALFAVGVLTLLICPLWAQEGEDPQQDVLGTLGELLIEGGLLMIPIAIASILTLGLAFERVWALRRDKVVPPVVWEEVKVLLREGQPVAKLRVNRRQLERIVRRRR